MWDRTYVKSKLKASGLHMMLSAAAFCPVLYLILRHWYPQPWFPIDGGWQGVRIMIWVDLVLGPSLTFLVYNRAKSRRALAVDFMTIGLLQAAAFTWGVHAVHSQRPVAISYLDGGFYSVQEGALRRQSHAVADLAQFDSRIPALVFAQEPKSVAEGLAILDVMRRQDVTTYEVFSLLHPLNAHLDEVWEGSDALAELLWADAGETAKLERILEQHPGLKREDLRFAWFLGRYQEATLVFDKQGNVLGTVSYVDPKASQDRKPANTP